MRREEEQRAEGKRAESREQSDRRTFAGQYAAKKSLAQIVAPALRNTDCVGEMWQ